MFATQKEIINSILRHLNFLIEKYKMSFCFQTFDEYRGFCGPIDTYSFFNPNGCFTLHHVVQRGEWGWYVSDSFATDQDLLLSREIDQSAYVDKASLSMKGWLAQLSKSIQKQIASSGQFFGIDVVNKETEEKE